MRIEFVEKFVEFEQFERRGVRYLTDSEQHEYAMLGTIGAILGVWTTKQVSMQDEFLVWMLERRATLRNKSAEQYLENAE